MCFTMTLRFSRSFMRLSRRREKPSVNLPKSPMNFTRARKIASASESCVARGIARIRRAERRTSEPTVLNRERMKPEIPAPSRPPASIGSPRNSFVPITVESSAGSEIARSATPIAFVPGLENRRARNRRDPQTSNPAAISQAVNPNAVSSRRDHIAPTPPTQFAAFVFSPVVLEKKGAGSCGECESRESTVRIPATTRRRPIASSA